MPFSSPETFILTEILALKKLGVDQLLIPRDRSNRLIDNRAETLFKRTLIVP